MADKQTRKSRAQALQVLGRLFQDASVTAVAGSPQVCSDDMFHKVNGFLALLTSDVQC